MNYPKGGAFKLIETPDALVIVASNTNVRDGQPLIVADMTAMFQYLSRYLYAREQEGMELKQAHEVAMHDVGITQTVDNAKPN